MVDQPKPTAKKVKAKPKKKAKKKAVASKKKTIGHRQGTARKMVHLDVAAELRGSPEGSPMTQRCALPPNLRIGIDTPGPNREQIADLVVSFYRRVPVLRIAAPAAGISFDTVNRWQQEDSDFGRDLKLRLEQIRAERCIAVAERLEHPDVSNAEVKSKLTLLQNYSQGAFTQGVKQVEHTHGVSSSLAGLIADTRRASGAGAPRLPSARRPGDEDDGDDLPGSVRQPTRIIDADCHEVSSSSGVGQAPAPARGRQQDEEEYQGEDGGGEDRESWEDADEDEGDDGQQGEGVGR